MPEDPIKAALAELCAPRPAQHDPTLPACPLCGALALAGYAWVIWSDLAHDCHCVLERDHEYASGLLRLHRADRALPTYLAGLPERYRRYTLHNAPETPAHRPALSAARQLDGRWMYLFGAPGAGKTHLAVGLGRAYAEMGRTARFWSVNELVAVLRDAAFGRAARPDLLSADVLILDDAGKLKPTDFAYEQIYNALEGRWARERTTLITGNHNPGVVGLRLTPDGNPDAAAALTSRMGSGHVFEITGDDGRWGGGL